MAPLVVMVVAWILFRLLGAARILGAVGFWSGALRFALAVMFAFSTLAHFLPRTRLDLVRMVMPPAKDSQSRGA